MDKDLAYYEQNTNNLSAQNQSKIKYYLIFC